jgi:hypothetical protein
VALVLVPPEATWDASPYVEANGDVTNDASLDVIGRDLVVNVVSVDGDVVAAVAAVVVAVVVAMHEMQHEGSPEMMEVLKASSVSWDASLILAEDGEREIVACGDLMRNEEALKVDDGERNDGSGDC